jgi:hypothetical protein
MSFRPSLVLALILSVAPHASAKAPTLTGLFPAGACRGKTITVTASGTFDRWPARCWTDGRGVEIEPMTEKGKLAVRVADDAEPGVHWVRLADDEGATALRPFVVGTLPEADEAEPNDDPRKPQRLDSPSATVNGRLAKKGDVDGYSMAVRRGQTLVADLEANRHLGSPMDAVLQVVSPAGFVLAQNDDAVGRDPRIVFHVPADGTYVVRVFAFPTTPDSTIAFAGGDAFVYRLTLTTAGFLDHAFPFAVGRDCSCRVEAIGANLDDDVRMLAVPDGDDPRDRLRVFHPRLAGTAEVRRVPYAAAIEAEPNDPSRPHAIVVPVALSGRIDPPGDRDTFRIALRKGEKTAFRVESRSLGMPLDPVLRLTDPSGKILTESDDSAGGRDPGFSFSAPADGEYRLIVSDLNGRGGPAFDYLLSVLTPDPDFALSIATDRFEIVPGKTTGITVAVDRKDGFAGPIEIVAEELPEGISASPVTSRAGDPSAKSVTLQLSADCCSHPGPFRIVGKAVDGSTSPRTARATIEGFDAKTDRPWLTIRPDAGPPKAK